MSQLLGEEVITIVALEEIIGADLALIGNQEEIEVIGQKDVSIVEKKAICQAVALILKRRERKAALTVEKKAICQIPALTLRKKDLVQDHQRHVTIVEK